MPLQDLKAFTFKNRHLPGVPSAYEVKVQGIDLSEMTGTLLKKTEELTLYLLSLDERLKKIENDR